MLIDTGHWLPGRKVLMPRLPFGHLAATDAQILGSSDTKQVENSPDIDIAQFLPRRMETNIYDTDDRRPYRGSGSYMSGDRGLDRHTFKQSPALGPSTTVDRAHTSGCHDDHGKPPGRAGEQQGMLPSPFLATWTMSAFGLDRSETSESYLKRTVIS